MHNGKTDRLVAKFYKARLLILSLTASVACLPFLFPSDYLMGAGRYWENPASEVNVSLAGLRYYISEKQWIPLGHIRSINAPEGINVLYEGAVPLSAFWAKVMNQLFGVKINSIYVWSLACTILQGVSFAYLVTALNIRRPTVVVLAAVIGMLMPAYIWRLENTVALPHFLISFALASYFLVSRKDNPTMQIHRAIAFSAAMLVVSVLLNPYITAMIIPIFAASLMHAAVARRISPFYGVGALILVALGMAVTAFAFGYFHGDNLAEAAGGFDFFSMNLVGPFDVGHSSLFRHLWVPALLPANATGGQQEGMQYLGVGCLFLITFAAFLQGENTIKAIRHHYLLMIALLGMALFSLSNKIYFVNTLLFEFSVPKVLGGITETFRGSGRFFWPMAYLLVAVSIVGMVRRMPKFSPLILCVAIALQLADTIELRQSLWNILDGVNEEGKPAGKYDSPYSIGGVPSPVMNNLIKNHQAMRQYPSWWCGGVGNQMFEMEISYIASKYLVSQNSFYTGRANKDCYAEDLEARNVSALAPGTLYVFAQRYGEASRLHSQGVDLRACRSLDFFGSSTTEGVYPKEAPIVCSEQIRSQQIDLTSGVPPGWANGGGLFPLDRGRFADMPVIRRVSASGSFIEKLYRPENVIDKRTGEDDGRFPDFWLSPNWSDGWIRLDLDGSYLLSEVRILNTNNGAAGDRAAGTAKMELYGEDGAVSYTDEVRVSEYPQWTSVTINPPVSVNAVKILISKGKVNGTGLNEIQLLGAKVTN